MPLAKAYPAGGNVMVDNLWYKDAQEGIQVKLEVTILWMPFCPGFQRKTKTCLHPWRRKGRDLIAKIWNMFRDLWESKDDSQLTVEAHAWANCHSVINICRPPIHWQFSFHQLARYPLRDGSFASHNFTRLVAKIPSVMEVAPRCKLLVHCLHFIQCLTLYKLLTLLPPLTLCTA